MNNTPKTSARHATNALTWPMLAALWNMSEAETRREARLLARDECGQPDARGDELLPLMARLMAKWAAHQVRWSSVK